jgi:hypothetical protein
VLQCGFRIGDADPCWAQHVWLSERMTQAEKEIVNLL